MQERLIGPGTSGVLSVEFVTLPVAIVPFTCMLEQLYVKSTPFSQIAQPSHPYWPSYSPTARIALHLVYLSEVALRTNPKAIVRNPLPRKYKEEPSFSIFGLVEYAYGGRSVDSAVYQVLFEQCTALDDDDDDDDDTHTSSFNGSQSTYTLLPPPQ